MVISSAKLYRHSLYREIYNDIARFLCDSMVFLLIVNKVLLKLIALIRMQYILCVVVAVPMCTGCAEPIFDRFILKVQERSWHSRCLKCSDCHAHLSDKCFSKGDDVYCKDDFFRLVQSRDASYFCL